LTLVGGVGVGGTSTQIGGVTAEQLAEAQRRQALQDANKAAAAAAAAERAAAAAAGGGVGGNGPNGGTAWGPPVGIPNNFWGFAMMMIGMR
jgi:hypothetical protein